MKLAAGIVLKVSPVNSLKTKIKTKTKTKKVRHKKTRKSGFFYEL